VFLSYARSDGEAYANQLRQRLNQDLPSLPVWQDRPEIEGGVGWWRQIETALERVEFLVSVMTPEALASEVTAREWRAARQRGVCVFPVQGARLRFRRSAAAPLDGQGPLLRPRYPAGNLGTNGMFYAIA
jgi:hypothetical protein